MLVVVADAYQADIREDESPLVATHALDGEPRRILYWPSRSADNWLTIGRGSGWIGVVTSSRKH